MYLKWICFLRTLCSTYIRYITFCVLLKSITLWIYFVFDLLLGKYVKMLHYNGGIVYFPCISVHCQFCFKYFKAMLFSVLLYSNTFFWLLMPKRIELMLLARLGLIFSELSLVLPKIFLLSWNLYQYAF